MKRALAIGCVAALLTPSLVKAEPTFQADVYPIVKVSCVSCHGPKKQLGRFRADIREDYFKNTGNGPWVVPGDSKASRLVQLLSGSVKTNKSEDRHLVPAAQLDLIRAWIDSGGR